MTEKTAAENLRDAQDSLESVRNSLTFIKGLAYGGGVGFILGFLTALVSAI